MMIHPFPFDPTYGYDLPALLSLVAPPAVADFEAFWRFTYDQTREVDPNITWRPIDSVWPDVDLFEVEYDSLGGFRVGGWITRPRDAVVRRGMVQSHGYGGRSAVEPELLLSNCATIWPCARGFDRSARPDLPADSSTHVVFGIEDRETYIHRFCVADLWQAVSVLHEIIPETRDRTYFSGGSFGGGMGAMMLPWETRISRAFLDVPSFGNHPLRLSLRCEGSGEWVRRRYRQDSSIEQTLRYFDAAVAASFITTPTMVAAALFDPAVPPPGQFTVYNCLAGGKKLHTVEAAHYDWPGRSEVDRETMDVVRSWFDA